MKTNKINIFWMTVLTILCIVCFPVNPLTLSGLLETHIIMPLFILGWIFWAIGMILIMAPIVMFPRKGGVSKGKSFVHTTKLVDTGIYAVVRHPQYLGGILAVFIATPLLYPHWLFAVLGIPGIIITYWSTFLEERNLVKRFSDDYVTYARRVPRMNLILGIIRVIKKKST
jgi:protein-S-isoprenylcysteine O-methyltransferase Ste14